MIGTRCTIMGTDLVGLIVGRKIYSGDTDRYAVRYLDKSGNPQERWFTSGEISFGHREADANVVSLTVADRRAA